MGLMIQKKGNGNRSTWKRKLGWIVKPALGLRSSGVGNGAQRKWESGFGNGFMPHGPEWHSPQQDRIAGHPNKLIRRCATQLHAGNVGAVLMLKRNRAVGCELRTVVVSVHADFLILAPNPGNKSTARLLHDSSQLHTKAHKSSPSIQAKQLKTMGGNYLCSL